MLTRRHPGVQLDKEKQGGETAEPRVVKASIHFLRAGERDRETCSFQDQRQGDRETDQQGALQLHGGESGSELVS